MSDRTKHDAILTVLKTAGFREIRFTLAPTCFRINDGQDQSEREFSRAYFTQTSAETLQARTHEQILPLLKQHPGKKLHVAAHFTAIITPRMSSPKAAALRRTRKSSSRQEMNELSK